MADKSRPSSGSTTDGGTPADVAAGSQPPRRSEGPRVRPGNGLDRYFGISARRSTTGREVRGGLTTFFTMAYIVLLNPIILTSIPGPDGTPGADVTGTVLPFPAIAAVTALIARVMTILMGVIGRYPFAHATGLGINAILAAVVANQVS